MAAQQMSVQQQQTVARHLPADFVLFQDSFGVKLSYNAQTGQLYNFQFGNIQISLVNDTGELMIINGGVQTHFNLAYRINLVEARVIARCLPVVIQCWTQMIETGQTNFNEIIKHVREQVDRTRVSASPNATRNVSEQNGQNQNRQAYQPSQQQQQIQQLYNNLLTN